MPDQSYDPWLRKLSEHYAKVVWCEELQGHDMSDVGGAVYEAYRAFRVLSTVDLSVPPGPVVPWLQQTGFAYPWGLMLQASADFVLDSRVFGLIPLSHAILRQYPWEGEAPVRERELPLWPAEVGRARPPLGDLMVKGIVTQEWIDFLRSLQSDFRTMALDAMRLHTDPIAVRSLVYVVLFLCLDLFWVCFAHDYAHHLHIGEREEAEEVKARLDQWDKGANYAPRDYPDPEEDASTEDGSGAQNGPTASEA